MNRKRKETNQKRLETSKTSDFETETNDRGRCIGSLRCHFQCYIKAGQTGAQKILDLISRVTTFKKQQFKKISVDLFSRTEKV